MTSSVSESGPSPGDASARTAAVPVLPRAPSTVVRELEIQEAGLPWGRIILIALLAGAAFLYFWEPAADDLSTGKPNRTQVAHEAKPAQMRVTVKTAPAGGKVLLDGVDYGEAPATVPVPTDALSHKLCVQFGVAQTCRDLTGLALSKDDPYIFKVSAP